MLPRQEELEENCSLPEERRLGLLSVTAVQPLIKLYMSANTFLERFISTLWHLGSGGTPEWQTQWCGPGLCVPHPLCFSS